jgi:hypothetical protein
MKQYLTGMALISASMVSAAEMQQLTIDGKTISLSNSASLAPKVTRFSSNDGSLTVTDVGGKIAGSYHSKDGQFRVSGSWAAPVVTKLSPSFENDMQGMALPSKKELKTIQAKYAQQTQAQNDYVVDVIIWIDDLFLDELGMAGTRALAWEKIAYTNEVLANSNIPMTINPIVMETREMPEHDGTVVNLATGWFLNPDNGSESRIAYRDNWGADLFHVLKKRDDDDGSCGRVSYSTDFDEWLVIGVSSIGNECSVATFSHEVGHTLHAFHEREAYDLSDEQKLEYNYGFTCAGGASLMHTQWGTYNRQAFFSSPDKTYQDVACGSPKGEDDASDNSRALTEYASWRSGLKTQPSVLTGVTLSLDKAETTESDEAVTLTLTLDAAVESETSVEVFVQTGSATPDVDYTGIAERVVFAAGETVKTVTLNIVDDADFEAEETIDVLVQWPFRLTLNDSAEQTITLTDNDVQTGKVAFESSSVTVKENVSTVSLNLKRTDGSTSDISFNVVTEDGSATAGTDYEAIDQAVTFADGETQKAITVNIKGDTSDSNRTFDLILSGEQTGAITRATVTIENVAEVVTPPPAEEKSSGGGSMGWFIGGLLGLFLFRRKSH